MNNLVRTPSGSRKLGAMTLLILFLAGTAMLMMPITGAQDVLISDAYAAATHEYKLEVCVWGVCVSISYTVTHNHGNS